MNFQAIKLILSEYRGLIYIFFGILIILLTTLDEISTPLGTVKFTNILINILIISIAIIIIIFGFIEMYKQSKNNSHIRQKNKTLFLKKMSNGSIYDNRFLIKAVIQQSTFAYIYLALDQNNQNKEIILKIFKYEGQTEERQKHIENEAKFSEKIRNIKGIIKIYEVKWLNNKRILRLVMEFISGGNLEDILQSKVSITEKEALNIIIDLSTSIELLHKKKIIHCDIKPSNILLKNNLKNPILIDFGTAKYLSEYSSSKDTYTSFPYNPPEITEESCKINDRIDIYSLGMITLELITGIIVERDKEYFDSATMLVSEEDNIIIEGINIQKIINKKLLEISDKKLSKVIEKSLSYNTEDRYDSIASFKNDLITYIQSK